MLTILDLHTIERKLLFKDLIDLLLVISRHYPTYVFVLKIWKFVPLQVVKTCRGSSNIAPLIPNFDTKLRASGQPKVSAASSSKNSHWSYKKLGKPQSFGRREK